MYPILVLSCFAICVCDFGCFDVCHVCFLSYEYDQATHKCILYIIKYLMDEMCFLCFYIYIYLLLLIDVATVSRGHLFW